MRPLALSFTFALLLGGGCGEYAAPPQAPFGTLSIPLETQVNGVRYRLSGDSFVLSGPTTSTLQHNGSGSIVYAVAPPGSYDVELLDGWQLQRYGESGYEAIDAQLASANPLAVELVSGETTIATWVFRTQGESVPLEPGTFQGNLTVIDAENPTDSVFGDVTLGEPAHVEALSGVTSIAGSLTIGGNVGSLTPLAELTRIDGDLVIGGAAQLATLDGLEQLAQIGGALELSGNASLTELRALAGLASVDAIVIADNPALPTCEAEWLADAVGAAGGQPNPIEINGNDDTGSCP